MSGTAGASGVGTSASARTSAREAGADGIGSQGVAAGSPGAAGPRVSVNNGSSIHS